MTVAQAKLSAKANDVFEKMSNIRSTEDCLKLLRGDMQELDIRSRVTIQKSFEFMDLEDEKRLAMAGQRLCSGQAIVSEVHFVAEVLANFVEAGTRSPVMETIAEAMDEISDADYNNTTVLSGVLGNAIQEGFQRKHAKYKYQNPFKRSKNNRMRHISHR